MDLQQCSNRCHQRFEAPLISCVTGEWPTGKAHGEQPGFFHTEKRLNAVDNGVYLDYVWRISRLWWILDAAIILSLSPREASQSDVFFCLGPLLIVVKLFWTASGRGNNRRNNRISVVYCIPVMVGNWYLRRSDCNCVLYILKWCWAKERTCEWVCQMTGGY